MLDQVGLLLTVAPVTMRATSGHLPGSVTAELGRHVVWHRVMLAQVGLLLTAARVTSLATRGHLPGTVIAELGQHVQVRNAEFISMLVVLLCCPFPEYMLYPHTYDS